MPETGANGSLQGLVWRASACCQQSLVPAPQSRIHSGFLSCRSDLQYSELQDTEHTVQDSVDKWQESASSLELTAPLKIAPYSC